MKGMCLLIYLGFWVCRGKGMGGERIYRAKKKEYH